MAGPLIILYEISILVSQIAGPNKEKFEHTPTEVQEQQSEKWTSFNTSLNWEAAEISQIREIKGPVSRFNGAFQSVR